MGKWEKFFNHTHFENKCYAISLTESQHRELKNTLTRPLSGHANPM